jgi:hypothetical protein
VAPADLTHCVSTLCAAPARVAFAYLVDPGRLGEWALGCWGGAGGPDGVVRGTSLFDGGPSYARADPDEARLSVDFEVGEEPTRLTRRIAARVVPGDVLGRDPGTSLVILLAWRTAAMDDDRWRQLAVAHEAEALLLRHRIESEAARAA